MPSHYLPDGIGLTQRNKACPEAHRNSFKSRTNLHPKWYEKNTFLTPPLGTPFVCVLYVEHVLFAFQDEPRKCVNFYLNPATSALGPQMPSGNPPGVPRRAPSRGLPKASRDPSQEKSRSLPRVPRSFPKAFQEATQNAPGSHQFCEAFQVRACTLKEEEHNCRSPL